MTLYSPYGHTMSLPHKAIKSIKTTKLQFKTIDKKYKLQDCDLELLQFWISPFFVTHAENIVSRSDTNINNSLC